MRNPNGYGTVARLSGNRKKPYIVKKTKGWNEKGHPIYEIVGYTKTKEEGMMLLAEYNKDPWDVDKATLTLKELFDLWKVKKAVKLTEANRKKLTSAFRHCVRYEHLRYMSIKSFHMQDIVDNCGKSYSTQSAIKSLFRNLDNFASELEIPVKGYSQLVTTAPIPETSRTSFSEDEIQKVWEFYKRYKSGEHFPGISENYIDTILIFLYTGFRISELLNLKTADVNLIEGTFRGGIKTKAGKNRIVPIHSAIYDIVKRRVDPKQEYFLVPPASKKFGVGNYRRRFNGILNYLGINKTVHECRHTFATRLDSAGANRKCIDLMMGHASKDVGNRVYNHKTLEELKQAIELIK